MANCPYPRHRSSSSKAGLLLVRAYVQLGITAVELRLLGFRHFLRRVPASSGDQQPTPVSLQRARHYARWIETASRGYPWGVHCLERSTLLHLWLRRDGMPSELRIGVRRQGRGVAAHAWVELAGTIVSDPPAAVAPFTPLFAEHDDSYVGIEPLSAARE